MSIDVYYCSVCGLCTKAIEYLRSRGLSFSLHAVEWDGKADSFVDSDNTRAMYERCGEETDFVPHFFINGTHVAGWRKLEPMIESGEFDKLLEAGA